MGEREHHQADLESILLKIGSMAADATVEAMSVRNDHSHIDPRKHRHEHDYTYCCRVCGSPSPDSEDAHAVTFGDSAQKDGRTT